MSILNEINYFNKIQDKYLKKMRVVNTISVKFNRGRVAALYFFKKYKYFLQLRGHAATIEVEQSFICGHAATWP